MTLWNLMIVVCFAVLYFGLAMVFTQLRRLRDEIRVHFSSREFPELPATRVDDPLAEEADEPLRPSQPAILAEESLQPLRQDLMVLQKSLITAIHGIPAKISPELDGLHRQVQADVEALYRQMQVMERNLSRLGRGSGGGGETGSAPVVHAEDKYSEARLLLTNGVDEERVIEKTGLTVEEVSLLKRLSQDQERS